MHIIPSDSALHRHCVSAIKSNQAELFSKFIDATHHTPAPLVAYEPLTSYRVWLPFIGFIFIIALLLV